MAASYQKRNISIVPARLLALASRWLRVFLCAAIVALLVPAVARAAVGDGQAVYGQSGTGALKTNAYTNSSSTWGAQGSATTATVVDWVVAKASPQQNETIAASYIDAANDTLYVSRYNGSSWALDINPSCWSRLAVGEFY